MTITKEIEKLEKSAVRLTITVSKEDVNAEYNKVLAQYTKEAAIPGFRKGKVPSDILVRKFGEHFNKETTQNILEESLKTAFDSIEEKPIHTSTPELLTKEMIQPHQEYKFSVKYDIKPEFTVTNYKKVNVEKLQVIVNKKDEDEEIKKLQEQNAAVIDKEGGVIERGDIVTLDMVELLADESENEKSRRNDFTFTIGTGYNLYKLDEDLLGMKIQDTKIIPKTFPIDYEYAELANKTLKIRVLIKQIKEKQLPEIDNEFAQDLSEEYKTVEDLRAGIRKKLQETAEEKNRQQMISTLLDSLADATAIAVPDSLVINTISQSIQNTAYDLNVTPEILVKMLAEKDGKTIEQIVEDWRPKVEKQIKTKLISHKIIELEKLEMPLDEIRQYIETEAKRYKIAPDEFEQKLKEFDRYEGIRNSFLEKRCHDFLLENANIKKGKNIDYSEFMTASAG